MTWVKVCRPRFAGVQATRAALVRDRCLGLKIGRPTYAGLSASADESHSGDPNPRRFLC